MDLDTFLTGANRTFVAELYARYLEDPDSVDPSWGKLFRSFEDDMNGLLRDFHGASWAPRRESVIQSGNGHVEPVAIDREQGLIPPQHVQKATLDSIRALMLIRAYRVRGHLMANLDPLQLQPTTYHPELDPKNYGFGEGDYDRPIYIDYILGYETATLRTIIERLHQVYCGTIGVEYMHIQDPVIKSWIQERMEDHHGSWINQVEEKKTILKQLIEAEEFEHFLDRKYTGTKRFGLEGGESTIAAIHAIIERAAEYDAREIVLGMAHRGRLNVLANIMAKPLKVMFSEFQGNPIHPEDMQGSGDVKYHLGTSTDRTIGNHVMHLSLTANPSHLEVVNPVVLGKVRAKQDHAKDETRSKSIPLLLHGDAAFAGQGSVPETLVLSELRGYRVGGTLHIIINNQIGFTTSPISARSSPYCSDIAKGVQAPIWHVNGDDPEAVVAVAQLAVDYRQTFKHDVIIDLFCYRRYGHNELDDPFFTQPLMYQKVKTHVSVPNIYAKKLEEEGVVSAAEAEKIREGFHRHLEVSFKEAENLKSMKLDWLEGKWHGLIEAKNKDIDDQGQTGIDVKVLKDIIERITTFPERFNPHPRLNKLLDVKRKMAKTGKGVDWATAEALAFGTLVLEGTPVRLSGQDCPRGTFSQRHAVWVDQKTEEHYIPLNHLKKNQALFDPIDSPLSELGVLGFDYGYSLADPHQLVLWEAQFGDFSNGAQVIIDQFISSGESKWLRMSGIVMLLPHGYEGQGPEHSSARLERYLQLCAENNMQVANCTTPANYFHILRRQMHRNFRKPLIIMTPKYLLRHKLCVSALKDMGEGTHFKPLLSDDRTLDNKKVKRVVICSGKVYYDLFEEREKRGTKTVKLLRLEQLYPCPLVDLTKELAKTPKAELMWCQEEPQNMGAWTFIEPYLEEAMKKAKLQQKRPTYIGRPASASPATGYQNRYLSKQHEIVDQALVFS